MGRFDGKKAVVTGGSSGFGLATAQMLVDEGARVLVTGRDRARLDAAGRQLGPRATAVHSDAGSLSDIAALADRVKAEFGTVDALFANAGVNAFAPFEETSEELFDQLMTVNVKGPYFTVQHFAPLLAAGSSVVFTTSVANTLGLPMLSAYAAGKAALRSLTRSLARELLPRNVRVNAVSPGPIDSGILEKSMPQDAAEQTKAQMAADNPLRRMGTPDEVAEAVVFLAFDATYTTGAELVVDGGGSQL
ncbi:MULTISPECIES: glucose 1-dehydrogenase [Streptomyces]|uniref:glucose 1-dehydrogenase n=1 Tax=Streptomyces TaxID=1883 RepID=UPI0004CAB90A|nr:MULTISPECIES: glucose 1-dehydrogenase [Streptomyces]